MASNFLFRACLAAFIFIATARVCFAVSCGDTIATDETLTADLNCSTDPALIIDEGGSLDLNAFKVTCNGTLYGIVLDADKTSIANGSIGNCADTALTLAGSGHKVTGVYIFNSDVGISAPTVDATGIKIKDVAIVGATVGFDIAALGASITGVSISASVTGISLSGSGNKVKDVTVDQPNWGLYLPGNGANKVSNLRVADTATGVRCTSPDNKFSNIHSIDHSVDGFYMGAGGNKLAGGTFINEGSSSYGIFLPNGTGNSVSNSVTLAGQKGIYALLPAEISKNRLFGSSDHGVFTTASDSIIKGNVGLGNGTYDFDDAAFGCGNNVWAKNIGKKGQSCIE